MKTMIEYLEDMAQRESKIRAALKRSLAFDLGTYPPVFQYIERWIGEDDNDWRRFVYYLVAGLWALQRRESRKGIGLKMTEAIRMFYFSNEQSPSVERRFIAILDADEGQLAYRLRQMIALLKDYPIDFVDLLRDLLFWNHPDKLVQIKWAKIFYRNSVESNEAETINEKEN
ncbi:MAG: type I-E CRISPR-associated protein Cse2/CasB [Candidatus Omnitrophota bacterium]